MSTTTSTRIRDGRTPEERTRTFLPGMRTSEMMPLYDTLTRLTGARRHHRRTVAVAAIVDGDAVLDVGCGTGNLALAALRAAPEARVSGLDPDATALRIAARKATRRGVGLDLVQGYADRLPAEDGSLDKVVSALALHHIDEAQRRAFAAEALRTLRPGGTVTILDFAGSEHGTGAHGEGARHRPFRHLRHLRRRQHPHGVEQAPSPLVALLGDADFTGAREVERVSGRLGELVIVQAVRAPVE